MQLSEEWLKAQGNSEVILCLSPEAHLIKDTLIIEILSLYIPIVKFIQRHCLLAIINISASFSAVWFWKEKKGPLFSYKMRWKVPLLWIEIGKRDPLGKYKSNNPAIESYIYQNGYDQKLKGQYMFKDLEPGKHFTITSHSAILNNHTLEINLEVS